MGHCPPCDDSGFHCSINKHFHKRHICGGQGVGGGRERQRACVLALPPRNNTYHFSHAKPSCCHSQLRRGREYKPPPPPPYLEGKENWISVYLCNVCHVLLGLVSWRMSPSFTFTPSPLHERTHTEDLQGSGEGGRPSSIAAHCNLQGTFLKTRCQGKPVNSRVFSLGATRH